MVALDNFLLIGFLEWIRYTIHAVAPTRVTTAGQAESELGEGELR